MWIWFSLLLLLTGAVLAQPAQPTINDHYVQILEIQRNKAMTLAAQLEAHLVQVQEENAKLKAEVEGLKKK